MSNLQVPQVQDLWWILENIPLQSNMIEPEQILSPCVSYLCTSLVNCTWKYEELHFYTVNLFHKWLLTSVMNSFHGK